MSASIDQVSLDFAKALEAEIQSKQLYLDLDKTMPNDFAFVIHDPDDDHYDPWEFDRFRCRSNEIFLTREFDGEKITVRVNMPCFPRYDDGDSYCGDFGSRHRRGAKKLDADPLKLTVEISKRKGRMSSFNVSVAAGNVTVESMNVHVTSDEEYSYFPDPDEYIVDKKGNLQRGLREYLKARGIEKSSTDILYDYMFRKFNTQPTNVLKKVLKFLKD